MNLPRVESRLRTKSVSFETHIGLLWGKSVLLDQVLFHLMNNTKNNNQASQVYLYDSLCSYPYSPSVFHKFSDFSYELILLLSPRFSTTQWRFCDVLSHIISMLLRFLILVQSLRVYFLLLMCPLQCWACEDHMAVPSLLGTCQGSASLLVKSCWTNS